MQKHVAYFVVAAIFIALGLFLLGGGFMLFLSPNAKPTAATWPLTYQISGSLIGLGLTLAIIGAVVRVIGRR